MIFQHLVMLCPTLVDRGGHEFDYTRMVAEASLGRGMDVVSVVPRLAIESMQALGKTEPLLLSYGYPPSLWRRAIVVWRRFRKYTHIFRQLGRSNTIWFAHSLPQNELAVVGAAWLFARCHRQALVLFIRQDIGASLIKRFLVAFLSCITWWRVRFVTDGDRLAERLSLRFKSPVVEMPVPVEIPPLPERTEIVCGYFGARRRVKGFDVLPLLIKSGQAVFPSADFVVQAYAHRDDKSDEILNQALRVIKGSKVVRVIEEALDSKSFERELVACSIVLLPYSAEAYREGTSGIFVTAVVARSVVIVTDGTWMARQAAKYDLSRVVLLPPNPTLEEANMAMRQAHALLVAPKTPSMAEQDWCRSHSPIKLVDILTSIEFNAGDA